MTTKAQPLSVSIIVPVYNEQDHLKACLESIQKQTVKPAEVIVVDNNSTDNSVTIAKRYRFVRVITEPKQSVLYARNRGFNAAKTDIIGRIDADTILSEDWVERALQIFADPLVAAATGPMYFYDMPFSPSNGMLDHLFKGTLYKFDKKFSFLAGNNMAIRRSAWEKIKSQVCDDKTIHEDLDLAIHLNRSGLKTVYDTRLRAGMSSRRYDDSPSQLRRYTSMTKQAFRKHGLKPFGVHVSEAAYTAGYFALWPLRRSYNPKTGRHSLDQFIQGKTPRKNPMD